MHRYIATIVAIGAAVILVGCGHSRLIGSWPGEGDESALPSFALASDFPADIVIPDIEGMRSTAFVVSSFDPAGVLAIDIDASPMQLSNAFSGMTCPPGSGIPAKLIITAINQGYLLTSNSVISFDPATGDIYRTIDVLEPIQIDEGLTNSDSTQADTTLTPSYPADLARIDDKLFVSTANYLSTQEPALAAPGTIQVFQIGNDGTIRRIGYIITSDYNPTGLSVRNGSELLITNSGVIDIVDAQGSPQTPSSIDIVDPETLSITATIALDMVAASFHGLALTHDGSRGFIGSAAYGQVYEVDLINRQVLRGIDNPHIVTDGYDFISDVDLSVGNHFLFAASFEQSSVYPFDLSQIPPTRGDAFVVGYPSGVTEENPSGANTGAGPMAVRPGSRGIDYQGADLFVLTGYPGTLVAITTEAPAQAIQPVTDEVTDEDAPADDDTPVPDPPTGDDSDPCQGFAQAIHSVDYGDGAGFGQSSLPEIVLGPPQGAGELMGGTHVLSLGGQGEIVLDLGTCPAVDGPEEDFIVFENAFYIGGNPQAPYAELGVVAVSADGVNFVEFDCSSAAYPYDGCAGWHPVYSHPDNDISPFDVDNAGGEAFDLSEVGLDSARYIRIRDLNGSGGGGAVGFDLDAIAVVNGEIENP
jgi:hypothetical protein